jgi:hypothetical protein
MWSRSVARRLVLALVDDLLDLVARVLGEFLDLVDGVLDLARGVLDDFLDGN